MVRTPNKELDVALELFNSELKKLKSLEKEQAVIKKAERKKADAVKALQEAEKNPDLSSEEKAQAKATWLKADDDLKRILKQKKHKKDHLRRLKVMCWMKKSKSQPKNLKISKVKT